MKKAFTLLELLIVIIIIGILASLALPRFQRTTRTAVAAEALQILNQLRGSMERYALLHSNAYTGASLDDAACGCSGGYNLDVDCPMDTVGRSFNYYFTAAPGATDFDIRAADIGGACGGAETDAIEIDEAGTITGSGVYSGMSR